MKEKPILFSGPMVRAILEGRKTQTRRVVKPSPPDYINELHGGEFSMRVPYRMRDDNDDPAGFGFQDDNGNYWRCPYGHVGDRLWVKETFCTTGDDGRVNVCWRADGWGDCPADDGKWKPSIFMPRKFSRITMEIVSVRVERLQDTSEADAAAEGAMPTLGRLAATIIGTKGTCRIGYAQIWESINGEGSWAKNPWVWVIEFKRI